MNATKNPLKKFKEQLLEFAKEERRGIRNPFVIVPIDPPFEHRAAEKLGNWANQISSSSNNIKAYPIWLDKLMPKTEVFQLVVNLDIGRDDTKIVEKTLQDNLANNLVDLIIDEKLKGNIEKRKQILLLLKLGSLYPFTRASQLLDELDRRNVRSTIGILFPGEIFAGKLSFFGKRSRHYYPAHRIDSQIKGVHLQ